MYVNGSFTVEAALLMILILALMALLILTAVSAFRDIGAEAAAISSAEASDYGSGFLPSDLVRIGLFIGEWLPER